MKAITMAGKRKRAIAKATIKEGKGIVRVNNTALDFYEPKIAREKIQEPLILAGDVTKKLDIEVVVNGGGPNAQAEAARLAIGRALAKHSKKLEKIFLNYDRMLLVADVRRKESSKPNRQGQARAKRQKSYR